MKLSTSLGSFENTGAYKKKKRVVVYHNHLPRLAAKGNVILDFSDGDMTTATMTITLPITLTQRTMDINTAYNIL